MFGDRKELILPLVLDIANLVQMAAQTNDAEPPPQDAAAKATTAGKTLAVRDQYELLPSAELTSSRVERSAPQLAALNDDRMVVEEPAPVEISDNRKEGRSLIVNRSAPFYDHLMKKIIPRVRTPTIQRRSDVAASPGLNKAPFVVPSTQNGNNIPETTISHVQRNNTESYNEVEDLALRALNGTVLDTDSAAQLNNNDDDEDEETLPTAEKLIGGRYRKKPHSRYSHRKPPSYPISNPSLCEKFTGSVCLRVEDYPMYV